MNLSNNIKNAKSTVEDNVTYVYNKPKEYVEDKIFQANDKFREKVSDVKDYAELKYITAKEYTENL